MRQRNDLINIICHFHIEQLVHLRPQHIAVNDIYVSMQYVHTLNLAKTAIIIISDLLYLVLFFTAFRLLQSGTFQNQTGVSGQVLKLVNTMFLLDLIFTQKGDTL